MSEGGREGGSEWMRKGGRREGGSEAGRKGEGERGKE